MINKMPKADKVNATLLKDFEVVERNRCRGLEVFVYNGIPNKESLILQISKGEHNHAYNKVITKMCMALVWI